jgi:hypothetical protein
MAIFQCVLYVKSGDRGGHNYHVGCGIVLPPHFYFLSHSMEEWRYNESCMESGIYSVFNNAVSTVMVI